MCEEMQIVSLGKHTVVRSFMCSLDFSWDQTLLVPNLLSWFLSKVLTERYQQIVAGGQPSTKISISESAQQLE